MKSLKHLLINRRIYLSVKASLMLKLILIPGLLWVGMGACHKDDQDIDNQVILGSPESNSNYFFCYTSADNQFYKTVTVGTDLGDELCNGTGMDDRNYGTMGVETDRGIWNNYYGRLDTETSHGTPDILVMAIDNPFGAD